MSAEPDLDALAERAKGGDRNALEALVRGLQDPLYRLATRYLGDRERARDATQEISILVITKLSTFRGESALRTWAYRVACRHLLRARAARREIALDDIAASLAQPPNDIAPSTLARADARLLEEEVFLGCTQAMLRALDRPQRIAFVLGGICELDARDAAYALGITEVAFRKRLSRARGALDAFLTAHCGVADASNPCRCRHQVNLRVQRGLLDPGCLRFAGASARTSVEALRARAEVGKVKRALDLYRAQPVEHAPEDFAAHLRAMLDDPTLRVFH